MTNIQSSNVVKLLFALLVMLLFSYDRNLLITHYLVGGSKNLGLLTMTSVLLALGFLLLLVASKGSLSIRRSQRSLLTVAALLCAYFAAHEAFFRDGLTSAKYSAFLGIISIAVMCRYNAYYIYKILGYLGGLICLFIIAQQLLLLFSTDGDISKFDVAIKGEDWGRWRSCDFVRPYGLGLMERCSASQNISLFGFNVNRSLFFSTEPKYIASILLVTLSSLLISNGDSVAKKVFTALHFLALFFVFSASSILILFASWLILRIRFVGPVLYTFSVFLFPVVVFPLFLSLLTSGAGLDGFLLNRAMSGAASVGEGGLHNISIFGEAFGSCADQICKDSRGLISNLTDTYGLIGSIIFALLFYYAVVPLFQLAGQKKIPNSKNFALMVMLNTYVVFNIYFFGDIFNMFGVLIMLTIILLPSHFFKMYYLNRSPDSPSLNK